MAAPSSGLSASVTRILYLTGFPKELKTKDIHSAFNEWENSNGGFRIKWRDDTSLLIVFQDPSVAKRAYLRTLAFPPAILTSASGEAASIKPYDGADAQQVIQHVVNRGHSSNPSRHNARASSVSTVIGVGRDRAFSGSNPPLPTLRGGPLHIQLSSSGSGASIPEQADGMSLASPISAAREPSPTLPDLPSHPTLNSLINSSLGDVVSQEAPTDPAILASLEGAGSGPRIGDPGKRMLGAALGVRHPGLPPRIPGGGGGIPLDQGLRDVQGAMGGLTVGE